MHIPSEMLSGGVCPVSAAVSAVGIAAAATFILRRKSPAPSAAKFALTGALVFALQMLNYPIWSGVSGHLIGGVLAAALLGVPGGVLCTATVLTVQALLFADGGLIELGANILNMSVIGAGAGGLILAALEKRGVPRAASVFVAGAASVMLAACALGVELAAGSAATPDAITTVIGVHAALAFVEGAATLALVSILRANAGTTELSRKGTVAIAGLTVATLAATPLASAFPDAFEWTMKRFSLLPDAPNFVNAPFADYVVPAISGEMFSTILAGVLGAGATFVCGYFLISVLHRGNAEKA